MDTSSARKLSDSILNAIENAQLANLDEQKEPSQYTDIVYEVVHSHLAPLVSLQAFQTICKNIPVMDPLGYSQSSRQAFASLLSGLLPDAAEQLR